MPFSFFQHTADVGVDVRAPTLDALFADAAVALVSTLVHGTPRNEARWTVDLASPELDLLLVDWLSELLYGFETRGFVPAVILPRVTRDEAWRLHAEVGGELLASARLPVKVLVKAVTYHALEVLETEAGWTARVVFDI